MKLHFNRKYSTGLSLIELMVAMVVGLIIIGGTASVYLASKQSYIEVERMARMSQNGRFALQMVSEALVHAGYTGEIPTGNIEKDAQLTAVGGTDCSNTGAAYDIDNYLLGATSDSGGLALGCITDAVGSTSVLIVKNVRPMKLDVADITASNTYIVANNVTGVMFDGADTSSIPDTTDSGTIPNGSAWIYESQIYYIREDDSGNTSLSRKILELSSGSPAVMSYTTQDLVPGVENMNLLFGMDTNADGDIDLYRTAAQMLVTDWNNVGSIQINILLRSETTDPQYTDDKTYNLGAGVTISDPDDNYHRMVMQSTVSLRNPKFVIRGNL